MVDIYDVTMATACDASVIASTLHEYGNGNMGSGLLKYGKDMLSVGEKIGYENAMNEIWPVAFEEGKKVGFTNGTLLGIAIGTAVTIGIGLTVWGVKKAKDKKDENNPEKAEKVENEEDHDGDNLCAV